MESSASTCGRPAELGLDGVRAARCRAEQAGRLGPSASGRAPRCPSSSSPPRLLRGARDGERQERQGSRRRQAKSPARTRRAGVVISRNDSEIAWPAPPPGGQARRAYCAHAAAAGCLPPQAPAPPPSPLSRRRGAARGPLGRGQVYRSLTCLWPRTTRTRRRGDSITTTACGPDSG